MTGRGWSPARRALLAGLTSLVLGGALAGTASAAGTLYWSNFDTGLMSSGLDGAGAQRFDPTDTAATTPDGLAIDSATGRIYWASSNGSQIHWAALDGSASGLLDTGAAPVDRPFGLAIDVADRRLYWANFGASDTDDSIAFARLDGSGGQELDTSGAVIDRPDAIMVDPVERRVWWTNSNSIASTSLDGGDGRGFDPQDASISNPSGLAIDPLSRRLYWTSAGDSQIWSARLDGGDPRQLDTTGATARGMQGLALDPVAGRVWWGNSGTVAVSSAALTGAGGRDLVLANSGAEDAFPVLQLPPQPVTPPALAGGASLGATLSCAPAAWAADAAEASLFRAPQSVAVQWTRDGQAIPGATGATLVASAAGDYRCVETATNHAGSTAQTSQALHVGPPAGPPAGGGGQTPPAAFAAATQVTLRLPAARIAAGKPIAVRVTNANGFTVGGRLSAATTKPTAGRHIALAAKRFSLAARRSQTVTLTLPKTLRRALARRHAISLRLTIVVTDPAGHRRTIVKTVTLRLKTARTRR